nr:MAG: capsid protein [Cressdnaviricota sp.]
MLSFLLYDMGELSANLPVRVPTNMFMAGQRALIGAHRFLRSRAAKHTVTKGLKKALYKSFSQMTPTTRSKAKITEIGDAGHGKTVFVADTRKILSAAKGRAKGFTKRKYAAKTRRVAKRRVVKKKKTRRVYRRKGKAAKIDYARGVVVKSVINAAVTDLDSLYIYHGTPVGQIMRIIWRTVFRDLFKKAGQQYTDWEAYIPGGALGTVSIKITYVLNPYATNPSTASYTATISSDSFESFFATFYTGILGIIQASPAVFFLHLELYDGSTALTTTGGIASLHFEEYVVSIKHNSTLRFQNQTLAADPTTVADKTLSTDIYSQPAQYKKYWIKGSNGAYPRTRTDNNLALSPILAPSIETGVGSIKGSSLGTSGQNATTGTLINPMLVLPPGGFFSKSSCSKLIQIQPGEIQSDYVSFSATHKFPKWMEMLSDTVQSTFSLADFGKVNLLGFTHLLRSNASNALAFEYECEMQVAAVGKSGKIKQLPLVLLVDAA